VTDRDEGGLGLTMRVPKAEQKATLAGWERMAVKRMQRNQDAESQSRGRASRDNS